MKPLKLELNQSVWRSWAKTWAQTPERNRSCGMVRGGGVERSLSPTSSTFTLIWLCRMMILRALPRGLPHWLTCTRLLFETVRSCQKTSSVILNPIQASCHWLCSFIYISVQTAWTPKEGFAQAQAFDTLEKGSWSTVPGRSSHHLGLRTITLPSHLWIAWNPPPGYHQTHKAVSIATTFPSECSPGLGTLW